jgi:hypothetical protein
MALTLCHRSRPSPEPSWISVEVSILFGRYYPDSDRPCCINIIDGLIVIIREDHNAQLL